MNIEALSDIPWICHLKLPARTVLVSNLSLNAKFDLLMKPHTGINVQLYLQLTWEREMKIITQKVFAVALLFMVILLVGCSNINNNGKYVKIRKPTPDQKYIATPNQLIVDYYCKSDPEGKKTFNAWIDKGRPVEQEIGHYFRFFNLAKPWPYWKSSSINLPYGLHRLTAGVYSGPLGCCEGKKDIDKCVDTRDVTVVNIPHRPIRIMPLGDSITKGQWGRNKEDCMVGYRYFLEKKLKNFDVDFVGSQSDPRSNIPIEVIPDCGGLSEEFDDRDHEGYFNLRTENFLNNAQPFSEVIIDNILQDNEPDIILLHIGTNDLKDLLRRLENIEENRRDSYIDDFTNSQIDEVVQLLNRIETYESSNGQQVIVFLALIINRYPIQDFITIFNNKLRVEAINRINDRMNKIIVVDMENDAGINYESELYDGEHPNLAGYKKMANLWYRHLVNFLPTPQ